MLILQRQIDESIVIGETIRVMVVRCGGGKVSLGIDAPLDLPIRREELAPLEGSARAARILRAEHGRP